MLTIDRFTLREFGKSLQEDECSIATIEKCMRDVKALAFFCKGKIEDKSQLLVYKEYLKEKR